MDPGVIPLHSSSPPPLDSDGEKAEEDEFGDFGGFSLGVSCSALSRTEFTDPPFSLRQSRPATDPAAHPPNSSFNPTVEQSQPTSTVTSRFGRGQVGVKGQRRDAEPSLHLTNGYPESHRTSKLPASGTHTASVPDTLSPREETGFADFTVFTERATHPWCCGFSPVGGAELHGRVEGANLANSLGEQSCDSGDSGRKERDRTTVKHCEQREAAPMQSSQDHQPQDPVVALALPSEEPLPVEEGLGEPGDRQRERRPTLSLNTNSPQTAELEEVRKSEEDGGDGEGCASPFPLAASLCESVSEDFASFCDVVTPEGHSDDIDANPSPAPQEDKTDGEEEEEEEEEEKELGNIRNADSLAHQDKPSPSQSEMGQGAVRFDQSETETQETSANSDQSESRTDAEEGFADFKSTSEHRGDGDRVQTVDTGERRPGSLPPSDSFADFCSAPAGAGGDGSWGEFRDQKGAAEVKTWAQFGEEGSAGQAERDSQEEEQDQDGRGGDPHTSSGGDPHTSRGGDPHTRRDSWQATLSTRVHKLLQTSFPDVLVPAVEDEEEVPSLSVLLQAQNQQTEEEEEEGEGKQQQSLPRVYRVQWGAWRQHQDVHSAVGLRFQWGGSHTNRTLLRCLGVDTRNIVFTGQRKKPMVVPAFASSLGMLEPTKEPLSAVCSPERTAIATQRPPGPQDRQGPSTDSVQVAPRSSQLDWSSSGLSNPQDGCSALNLDCFGPADESGSSSRSNSPPPGLDRELYELTITKLEAGTSSPSEDTFNRLMSTAEMTSTSVRIPVCDGELSAEAGSVICGLPDLSFMKANFLMFPSVLTPKKFSSPTLE